MIRYLCDGCGLELESDGSNHFIIKIEAFAAAGRLEFSKEELQRNHEAEIRRLMADLENQSPDQIEDPIYRAFRYDLCPACHSKYLQTPLAGVVSK